MNALAQQWSEAFQNRETRPEPAWLTDLRVQAASQLSEHGLPHRKVEAWKYTPLKKLENMAPILAAATIDGRAAPPAGQVIESTGFSLDIVDGLAVTEPARIPDGVSVLSLSEGMAMYEDRLRGFIESLDITGSSSGFAAVNTAFLEQGLVVHVEENVDAGELSLHWVFSERSGGRMANFRMFLLLEPGARLSLVEHFGSHSGRDSALNVICHIELAADAKLDHVRVQNEADSVVLITSTDVEQRDTSNYSYAGFDLGGGLVRHELRSRLEGTGASTSLMGAYVLDGQRHVDNHISVEHIAPGCISEQFFRGVLGGRSRGVFNGKALICEGADGSNVRQSNANLLLSRLAEMDTKPELEIYADEVEASHGATVGQLDPEAVFYLRSRGLSNDAARHMLTSAFCRAVVDRLSDRDLGEWLVELLDRSMPVDTNDGEQEH